MGAGREDRKFHESEKKPVDIRSRFARDRDRVLYTAAFRRLAGVTQVAASDTGNPLHNRLTHVLEVAQIGRRLAERLLHDTAQREIALAIGGLDADVVETACLAHDLGHPPFGHIAEETLDECASSNRVEDGFEGNAQSFRIVARLAERGDQHPGLNLTRASLNAMLKYPWRRGKDGKEYRKFGCYAADAQIFDWARELDIGTKRKSAEAELMDWADDIAYSVLDLEDFYQAGWIPMDRLVEDVDEQNAFLGKTFDCWRMRGEHDGESTDEYRQAFLELVTSFFPFDRIYTGTADQRREVRTTTSFLIGRYISAITLQMPSSPMQPFVVIDPRMKREVTMLKELTWQYVIRHPSLATQQYGQRKVIRSLFDIYFEACRVRSQWHLLPPRWQEAASTEDVGGNDTARARLVCDFISGMAEPQAVELYQRLNGISLGTSLAVLAR